MGAHQESARCFQHYPQEVGQVLVNHLLLKLRHLLNLELVERKQLFHYLLLQEYRLNLKAAPSSMERQWNLIALHLHLKSIVESSKFCPRSKQADHLDQELA